MLDERDEVLMELTGGDLCHLEELLVGDDGVLVEKQQEEHLIVGAEELILLAFLEMATNLSVP